MAQESKRRADLETDFLHLARIALSGRTQDVQAIVRRAAKRYQSVTPNLADALTALLQESPTAASPLRRHAENPLPVDVDTRLHLMRVEMQPILDHEPIFSPKILDSLTQLVKERQNPEALVRAGLEPTRTALFTGPPGVGKTLAARWIARELAKPLLILDLAAVMSSYLGRTGSNLRHVIEYGKSIDCVLLLDELDAIAKRRDDRGEIGELKRLVTVLIQQIDDWPSSGVLLAATNHPDLLDPAIWRRFERHVEFNVPEAQEIAQFINSMLQPYLESAELWSGILAVAFSGQSFSDIEREIAIARRNAVLAGTAVSEHLAALLGNSTLSKSARIKLATTLVDERVLSQRKAHELTGVARDSIRERSRRRNRRTTSK